jgi:hypothetical protein
MLPVGLTLVTNINLKPLYTDWMNQYLFLLQHPLWIQMYNNHKLIDYS